MAIITPSAALQARIKVALASKNIGQELISDLSSAIASPALVSQMDPSILTEVSGVLTQAQLQAMSVTPVVLVPAPLSTQSLVVDSIEWSYIFATTAITGGGAIELQYASSAVNIVESNKTLITGGASIRRYMKPSVYDLDASTGTANGFDLAAVAGEAIQLTNATAAFTAGAAGTTLGYKIRYRLLTLI